MPPGLEAPPSRGTITHRRAQRDALRRDSRSPDGRFGVRSEGLPRPRRPEMRADCLSCPMGRTGGRTSRAAWAPDRGRVRGGSCCGPSARLPRNRQALEPRPRDGVGTGPRTSALVSAGDPGSRAPPAAEGHPASRGSAGHRTPRLGAWTGSAASTDASTENRVWFILLFHSRPNDRGSCRRSCPRRGGCARITEDAQVRGSWAECMELCFLCFCKIQVGRVAASLLGQMSKGRAASGPAGARLVDVPGFEPATLRCTGRRSHQLSRRPGPPSVVQGRGPGDVPTVRVSGVRARSALTGLARELGVRTGPVLCGKAGRSFLGQVWARRGRGRGDLPWCQAEEALPGKPSHAAQGPRQLPAACLAWEGAVVPTPLG